MSVSPLYEKPRQVDDIANCYFYHTMDLPGHGLVQGEWDLRGGLSKYLGGVSVQGKRVLDVGTASGFISFSVEQMGADVVAFDLSQRESWDVVPYKGLDNLAFALERRAHLERLNNGFWFAHRAYGSKAKLLLGTVYSVPPAIGPVDISVLGCVLLHLRDPFLALQNVVALTTQTVVVCDILPSWYGGRRRVATWLRRWCRSVPILDRCGRSLEKAEVLSFCPDARRHWPRETWWVLTPEVVTKFLGVLGFGLAEVFFHRQKGLSGEKELFTVVARRARVARQYQEV